MASRFVEISPAEFMPQSVYAELHKDGSAPTVSDMLRPKAISYDLGMKRQQPMRERELTPQELLNILDRKDTLRMVYVPHLLTQCVIWYVDMMIEYAKANRLQKYKRFTRLFTLIRDDYYKALCHEMRPSVYNMFTTQKERFFGECGFNIHKAVYTFNNAILKQFGNVPDAEMCCYANIVIAIVDYVDSFDRMMNAELAKRLNTTCRNYGDIRLGDMRTLCKQIAGDYVLKDDAQTKLMIEIMANKATVIINDML